MSMKFGGCYAFGSCSASHSHVLSPVKAVQDQSISVRWRHDHYASKSTGRRWRGSSLHVVRSQGRSYGTAPLDQQASIADVTSITFYNTKI